jgi:hypothetical protein
MKTTKDAGMSDASRDSTAIPSEQSAIRAKCFHPTGTFIEFKKEEIEQSIPDRFEQIVAKYRNHLAIKTANKTLTYDELNHGASTTTSLI